MQTVTNNYLIVIIFMLLKPFMDILITIDDDKHCLEYNVTKIVLSFLEVLKVAYPIYPCARTNCRKRHRHIVYPVDIQQAHEDFFNFKSLVSVLCICMQRHHNNTPAYLHVYQHLVLVFVDSIDQASLVYSCCAATTGNTMYSCYES